MTHLKVLIITLSLSALLMTPVQSEGETAGDFDYYVLSLSWSPNWCRHEGDARNAPQCAEGSALGWVLHGLWPQYEDGWPSYCHTVARDPSRSQTAAMADIMGSGGSAWHQWKKHGRCTGLSAVDYLNLARGAYRSVIRPPIFRKIDRKLKIDAHIVEVAFLEFNPHLTRDGLTVTCKSGAIAEVRICLNRDLTPRECAPDVARDCQLEDAIIDGLR